MAALVLKAGTERRLWCETCLTTAVVAFDVYALDPTGVSLFGTYRVCKRCQEDDHAPR